MIKRCKISVFICNLMCIGFAFAFLMSPIKFSEPVFALVENVRTTSAKSMILIEQSTLRPLYYHNENERLSMASTTKIITAIYAIEKNPNLDRVVEVPKVAVGIEGTSIGLKEGEHLTVRELLYGLMLRSGNDSAVALAVVTSGSEEKFVEEVNAFLHEKGFKNTQIKNSHGLHNKEHYTTASDLAKITAYAFNNETFKEIVSCREKTISNELKSSYSRKLKNKNKLLKSYKYANGVKTGFTSQAGRCFVGSAEKDGMQLICVVLNCSPMFEECQALFDKAFDEYKLFKVLSKEENFMSVNVDKTNGKFVDVKISNDFYYPMKRDELKNLKFEVKNVQKLVAPLEKGQLVAEVELSLENQLIFSEKIYTINSIDANTFNSKLERVIKKM